MFYLKFNLPLDSTVGRIYFIINILTDERKSYDTLISYEGLALLCEGGTLDKLKVDSGVRRKTQRRRVTLQMFILVSGH